MALLSVATSVRFAVVGVLLELAAACIQVAQGFPCHARVEAFNLLVLTFMAAGWALTTAAAAVEVQRRRKESQEQRRLAPPVALALVSLAGMSLALSAVAIRVGAC